MDVNSWQHQIILGTLFGNGYIFRTRKYFYLGFSESHDRNWFKYKSAELETVAARVPIVYSNNIWKWHSTSGDWSLYYEKFYKGDYKERVSVMYMDTLDRMQDIAFAVWFGDKGFWYSNHRIALRSSKFIDQDPAITFFNEVGMPCYEIKNSIVFTPEGTDKFLKLIAHRLPHYMHYKLVRKTD